MKKNLFALLLAALMVLSMLAGCGSQAPAETAAPTEAPAAAEVTEATQAAEAPAAGEMVQTLYAPNFSIEKLADGIKKVIDGDGRELILVPRTLAEVPAQYADSIVIRTPVENAVFMSDTQVCCFRDADQAVIDGIAGISGTRENFPGFTGIETAFDEGRLVSVGGGMGDPDYELLQSLNPDIVFVYTGEWGQTAIIEKLNELGIPYAVDNEYLEGNYMARMEWARFLLTFFNADESVDAQMAAAQKTIEDVKAAIAGLEQPKVAIFSVYDGQVNGTSNESWLGTMLSDMGGINAFADMPAGPLTLEAAFAAVQDADVIIYSSTPMWCPGMDAVLDAFPMLTDCAAYDTGRVYQYDNSFWVSIDQSHIMAADLASMIYPETFADRDLSYFVQLEK